MLSLSSTHFSLNIIEDLGRVRGITAVAEDSRMALQPLVIRLNNFPYIMLFFPLAPL